MVCHSINFFVTDKCCAKLFFQYLDCLWQQIKRLRSEMWVEKHIVRPYLAFDSVLCEALQHNLPPMVPPPHHPSTTYPLPQVIFRMFDYTDCPEVCWHFPRFYYYINIPRHSVLTYMRSNLGTYSSRTTLDRTLFNRGTVEACSANKSS